MDVWLHTFSFPHRVAEVAKQAEEWGFTGLLVADSQNLNADIWVELALAGAATERLLLGPGVTNPVTRHPAVTASAAATLQAETGGRAVLGLGRGDSAVTQLGMRPVPPAALERLLVTMQAYLRGETVDVDGVPTQIRWLTGSGAPKVPVVVAATGPQAIAVGARHAEALDFTVGAEHDRLRWAIGTAHRAGGARSDMLSLGAFVNVGVHPDRVVARDLVRGSTAIFARFAAEGAPSEGLSEVTRRGIGRLAAGYRAASHGQAAAPQARDLEDEFIDRFAVAGPPAEVAERLNDLASLGLRRVVVVPGSLDADPSLLQESNRRFASEVLPALMG
ncbi:MAG TPA: LLM class flavin-dependent oxidoreductase [Acidimicrobiales bacterium]|nr:LLM class flavin-dependent oxidoreductase [Acidimicrobiales bacterium]